MSIDYLDGERLKPQMQAFADQLMHKLQVETQESWKGTELSYWLCDLDDYMPAFHWLERAEAFGSIVAHQVALFKPEQHLPLHRGHVYFWRCDEYINGLGQLVDWNIERDRLSEALSNAVCTLLHWFRDSGEYYSIYYPQLKLYLPIAYGQGGATLEALWNVLPVIDVSMPELAEKVRRAVLHSLDFWCNSEYFVNYGLFANKDGAMLKKVTFLPDQGRDGYFAHANRCIYHAPKTIRECAGLLRKMCHALRKSPHAKIMKDNSSMAFAFLKAAESYPERYGSTIKKWLIKMNEICCQGLTPMYWHPLHGASRPMLRTSFTHINVLIYYYWWIHQDSTMIDMAIQIAESILERLKMPNGLLAEQPEIAETYFDSLTDVCVSFCELYEATGDSRWYQEALGLARNARKYHGTDKGHVLSVDGQGNIVNPTVSPRFNFLHVKSQMAIENAGNIQRNRELFDLLEDR